MINNINEYVGDQSIPKKLIFSIQNKKLSNSIIFYGPKGIGKATLSINIIKSLYKDLISDDKVDKHNNLINNNSHPNLRILKRLIKQH